MKQFKTALVIAILLFPASGSRAALITITDVTDGPPTFTVTTDIDVSSSVATPESLTITGIFHIPFGNGTMCNVVEACNQSFNLLEQGGSVSDTLHLVFAGPGGFGSVDWLEGFTLTFLSDTEVPLPPLPGGVNVFETADSTPLPINNGGVLNGTAFNISVASDVSEVPEPASLLLLGAGLTSIGIAAWLGRK